MILLETQHVTPTHADNSTPPVHPFVAWAQKVYDLECRTGVRPSRSSGHPWRKSAVSPQELLLHAIYLPGSGLCVS